jgi:hypothetical protein
VSESGIGHVLKFVAENDASNIEANLRTDVLGHQFVIASQNLELDTVTPKRLK